jgi:membrane fusion protein, multidrug efflux system
VSVPTFSETEQSVGRIIVATAAANRRRIVRGVLGVLLSGALIGAGAAGCDRKGNAAGPPQRPPPAVMVAPVLTRDVPIYIEQIGTISAVEMVRVMPQVTGRVVDRPFVDGAEVTPKDVLFKIDPRPFEAALAQAEANLSQAKLAQDWANLEFNRIKGLVGNKAISQQDYDQKQNAVAVSEAQFKAAKAAVESARLNVEYCTIKSPIVGHTGQRQVDVGNVVKANEQVLVTVQNLNTIYADFTIPERELQQVRDRMADGTLNVEVSIPMSREASAAAALQGAATRPSTQPAATQPAAARPATAPTTSAAPGTAPATQTAGGAATRPTVRTGDLTFLDTMVQPGLGTIRLRATLKNEDDYFWPGQFVNVRLILQTKKDAVLVPLQALQVGQRGPFVYVVKPDSTADLVQVQPGQRQGDLMVIESGLNAGQRVIVAGQSFVGPGAKVTVVEGVAGR